jgi:hypothetical protein
VRLIAALRPSIGKGLLLRVQEVAAWPRAGVNVIAVTSAAASLESELPVAVSLVSAVIRRTRSGHQSRHDDSGGSPAMPMMRGSRRK